jgi:multiple sugar transport system permease protein
MTQSAGKGMGDTSSSTAVLRRTGGVWQSRRVQRRIESVFGYVFMSVLAFVFLIPLFWMLSTSLKTRAQTWLFPPKWIPEPFVWTHFGRVFEVGPFALFVRNTMILAFWNILGQTLATTLVAYGFARLRFPGRGFLFMLMVATLMIPYQVTLIPTFLLFKALGWVNTYLPLTVPAFTGGAFFIFLMRQFMMTIPLELDNAAQIDGCNRFQVLFRILLPLCKPPLTLVVVFTFLGVWNDFFGPLIYLNEFKKYPLALGLNLLRGRGGTDWNMLMAASLMAVIPVLVLYFFAQKHIIGGIASVGLKG